MRVGQVDGGVHQVQQGIDLPFAYEGAYLEVASFRRTVDQRDVQTQPAGAELACAPSGDDVAAMQAWDEFPEHIDQHILLHVVGDQPDTRGLLRIGQAAGELNHI